MPRRRINPKKAKGGKREKKVRQENNSENIPGLLVRELAQSCPELAGDAIYERQLLNPSDPSRCMLDLSGCSMAALPNSFGALGEAPKPPKAIDLKECTKLTALPDSIGEIKTLKALKLSGCVSLSYLPDTIGQLKALSLELSDCVR